MTSSTAVSRISPESNAVRRFVTSSPVTAFAIGAFGVGWPVLALPVITGMSPSAPILIATYVALAGSALLVTRLVGGPGAMGRLLARTTRWRFGIGRWAVIVLAMPALTLAFAAASGTLQPPGNGWLGAAGTYLVQTFIIGSLTLNVAEELAWGGFVQTRLAERHGMLRGALLTAPMFVAIHLPLQFAPGWTWASVAMSVAILVLIAPFLRFVMGDHLEATGGSVLAVGIQHAAFNASGQLPITGGWQSLAAVVLFAVAVAVHRWRRKPVVSRPAQQLVRNPS